MGLYASDDMFKAKADKTLGNIEEVKEYINDIIVLIKGSLPQHMNHMGVIFSGLHVSVLKVNNTK